ncbi:phytanoyl-CoA dioxygenase family protein [Streptomyces sp. NBC_00525]|uniref:phytanoyl-CoA dioxygenase family protein n=1 Tax=Streptomyces sp. NBC_00525 TaxID=2903660 RepID=UPI002E800F86|nr:phytanoyl-CoA dioxygenase family protein [Streptomyces sp. NBC_00525]WUC98065.1 phytanoyl-CoA dioxygenase family protein [Streptomyces sp. NBC_00525]
MLDTASRDIREKGFVRLPGLAAGDALDRLRRAVGRIEELAADRTASGGEFILEAAGAGGWAAWQEGGGAIKGVLRSVDRIHHHVPEFDAVQRSLRLARGPVARCAGGVPGELVNAFLWAKPPVVGSAKPWHQDMAFAPPGFDTREHGIVTIWIALEPATTRNGCLEFVPGSHTLGLFPHSGDRERLPGEAPLAKAVEPHIADAHLVRAAEPVAVPLEPGSAVMFDGMVVHRSAPNTTEAEPRTAVSFVYRVPRPSWTRWEPAVPAGAAFDCGNSPVERRAQAAAPRARA